MGQHGKKKPAAKASTKASATKRKKKVKAEPSTRGLAAGDLRVRDVPPDVAKLASAIDADGGAALTVYKDPVGGHYHVLAALPIERVAPTPFQRDLSQPHVDRLARVIDDLDRFLDPIIAVREDDGTYHTPNGSHRLAALKQIGAKSVIGLVVADPRVAYRILALNTEKAHNLREKAMEVIRMARSLADLDPRPEKEFVLELEEAPLVTLGICYDRRPRLSGSSYHSILRKLDAFSDEPLPKALAMREKRADLLLAFDDAVTDAVKRLKDKGFDSPYLRAFVVARVNPLRFMKGDIPPFDEMIPSMTEKAKKFDPGKVDASQVARTGGAPDEG